MTSLNKIGMVNFKSNKLGQGYMDIHFFPAFGLSPKKKRLGLNKTQFYLIRILVRKERAAKKQS